MEFMPSVDLSVVSADRHNDLFGRCGLQSGHCVAEGTGKEEKRVLEHSGDVRSGEERAESVPAGNVIAVRDGVGVAGLSDRGWKSCTTVVCIGYGNRCIRTNRAGRSGRTLRLASGRRRVMHGAYAGRISGLKDVKYR